MTVFTPSYYPKSVLIPCVIDVEPFGGVWGSYFVFVLMFCGYRCFVIGVGQMFSFFVIFPFEFQTLIFEFLRLVVFVHFNLWNLKMNPWKLNFWICISLNFKEWILKDLDFQKLILEIQRIKFAFHRL